MRVFRSLQHEPPGFFTQCLQCAGAVVERFVVFHDESLENRVRVIQLALHDPIAVWRTTARRACACLCSRHSLHIEFALPALAVERVTAAAENSSAEARSREKTYANRSRAFRFKSSVSAAMGFAWKPP